MASDLGHAQPPPADLARRQLPIVLWNEQGTGPWFRIGKTRFKPGFFSQDPGWRFSSKDMPGTLYIGDSVETCFWEVFWSDLATRPPAERRIDMSKITERSAWRLAATANVLLVNTFDPEGMREMSAHSGTFLGPYAICQAWAKAIREHPARPHGILYESARNRNALCVALFEERCGTVELDFTDQTPPASSRELAQLLRRYGDLPPALLNESMADL